MKKLTPFLLVGLLATSLIIQPLHNRINKTRFVFNMCLVVCGALLSSLVTNPYNQPAIQTQDTSTPCNVTCCLNLLNTHPREENTLISQQSAPIPPSLTLEQRMEERRKRKLELEVALRPKRLAERAQRIAQIEARQNS